MLILKDKFTQTKKISLPPRPYFLSHYTWQAQYLLHWRFTLDGQTSSGMIKHTAHTHFPAGLTVTIRPLSWKYLTRGMVFCLKLVRRRSMALGLSSGRPCCSARFCSLSFKRWLVQARNTTRSGVQIYEEREDVANMTAEAKPLWLTLIHMWCTQWEPEGAQSRSCATVVELEKQLGVSLFL